MPGRTYNFAGTIAGVPFMRSVSADVDDEPAPDTTPPARPTGLVADGSSLAAIVLNWDDNVEPDLAGYNVFRAFFGTSAYVKLNQSGLVSASAFTDGSADIDVNYDYYVSAVDTSGNESQGSPLDSGLRLGPPPVNDPPAAVVDLTATPTFDEIALNWTDNTEPDLLGYRVYHASAEDGPYTLLASPAVSTYDDAAALEGEITYYRVVAVDNANQESPAVQIAAERPVPPMGTTVLFSSQATMSPATVQVFATPYGGQRYFKPGTTPRPGVALGNGTPLLARYRWRFYEQNGSTLNGVHNDLDGFNAAHVFENTGTTAKKFVVALEITQANGAKINASTTITVQRDTRTAVYCDGEDAVAGAADPGDGTLANPFRTFARAAAAVDRPDMKILVARSSKRYPVSAQISLSKKNTLVDVYTPALRSASLAAELQWQGNKSGFMFKVRGENITIRNLKASVANPVFNINGGVSFCGSGDSTTGAKNVSVYNITLGSGWASLFNQDIAPITPPDGVLLMNNVCPSRTLGQYGAYCVGANWAILGNQFIDVGLHCLRCAGVDNVLGAGNTLRRPRPPEDTILSRGCITDHVGDYHYWTRNLCSGGDMSTGPLTVNVNQAGDRNRWIVFDRNQGLGLAESNDGHFGGFYLHHGSEQVMLRNNHVKHKDWQAVIVEGFSDTWARDVSDLYVYNNTFQNTGFTGRCLKLQGPATRVRWRNNLYLAPELTDANQSGAVHVFGAITGFATDASDTRKPCDRNVWPPFVMTAVQPPVARARIFWLNVDRQVNLTDWNTQAEVGDDVGEQTVLQTQAGGTNLKPVTNSIAATYGRPVSGVWEDYYGTARSRTASTWAAGCAQAS